MGTWGTGVSSNDTYADVYSQFVELYNEGFSPSEISERLVRENQETIGIYEDAPNFWYAIANAQWECKALQPDVLQKVEHFVDTNADLRIWEELGATKSDLRAREKALKKLVAKLHSEKRNPRRRKRKRYFDSLFRKGDCLVYKMSNENFGAAFVLTDEAQTVVGVNYIAITTINSSQKPVLEDFVNAEVYVRRRRVNYSDAKGKLAEKIVDEPDISGYFATTFKAAPIEIEVVGRLPIYSEFVVSLSSSSPWQGLVSHVSDRETYERLNGKAESRVFLSKWIKRRGRFFGLLKR